MKNQGYLNTLSPGELLVIAFAWLLREASQWQQGRWRS